MINSVEELWRDVKSQCFIHLKNIKMFLYEKEKIYRILVQEIRKYLTNCETGISL